MWGHAVSQFTCWTKTRVTEKMVNDGIALHSCLNVLLHKTSETKISIESILKIFADNKKAQVT